MPLTDIAIRNAKGKETTQKLSDGGGLQLWVTPASGKNWQLAYRFDGKQKKLTLGSYPAVTLSEARDKRDDAKRLLASGLDPSQQKRIEKLASQESRANTFAKVAADLLEKKRREGKAHATLGKREWLYSMVNADLGERPIADITAAEVLHVLRKVEAKGLLETARRMKSAMSEVFRHAIPHQIQNDPTVGLKGKLASPVVKHRAAITDAKELGGLMRAIEGFAGQTVTIAALKCMALMFPRPGELRMAEWGEFDLGAGVWTIPASRAKMRRENRTPMSHQAIAVIESLKPLTGHSAFVFPHISNPRRPMSENTINAALRRMGYGPDEMTSHGFRAAASTLLNESGQWSPDAIERALAHVEANEVRKAYARGAFWDERVRMAQWWADYLGTLRDGANVILHCRT